jgi:predicted Zn-dependent peptidase
MVPKQSYHKTYVTLSTPLGSTTRHITTEDGVKELPLGIAHFLEHKLFDQGEEDISMTFAMNSAQVNAYTMNERTTYLFSCTDHLQTNVATLLNFVFYPTFTQAGIDKEIDIIAQEISMYQDDPNASIYMGILRNMYHNHPVKEDILGTKESISTITEQLLYDVHNAAYHPSKMVLFITGNVEPDNMLTFLKSHKINEIPYRDVTIRTNVDEPTELVQAHHQETMDIIIPNALFGIKLLVSNDMNKQKMRYEFLFSILSDMLVGKSTTTFITWLSKGLINDTFGMDITLEDDYGYVLFGSHTKQPDVFLDEMKQLLITLSPDQLEVTHFIRSKKQVIGQFIRALNSLEYIANQFTKYHFQGASLFDVLQVADTITFDDIKELIPLLSDSTHMTSFVMYSKKSH